MLELFLRVIESTKEGLSGFPANASNKNIEAATGSVRNGVLRDPTKITGKYLCQSLFFNKVAG